MTNPVRKFHRFVVMGDSYSEGMTDEVIDGKFRGWADRVADTLAKADPNFTYANLAIRGKLVSQVIADQIPQALPLITGPDTLVSFHAGANDALRPGYQSDVTIKAYQDAVRRIAATGATVMLFTVLERTGNKGRGAELWERRFSEFNQSVRAVGTEVGAVIVDANQEGFFSDRRFLAFDRLHLNSDGHFRCAQAVLEKLSYPFDPAWRTPLPPAKKIPWIIEKGITVIWFLTFALPWIYRRLRGRSSGDNRSAKYPEPISWPIK
jgi:lysophospholipase L1-like esterase